MANIRRVFLVLFADFVLKTTAFQVLVKAFVAFHLLFLLSGAIITVNLFFFAAVRIAVRQRLFSFLRVFQLAVDWRETLRDRVAAIVAP